MTLSQVQTVGAPRPKTWDDYERGCLGTFHGGYHDKESLAPFQHGMATVFNLLRSEFPPAEQCKAAPPTAERDRMRFGAACAAMTGICASAQYEGYTLSRVADESIANADALLAQLAKEPANRPTLVAAARLALSREQDEDVHAALEAALAKEPQA